MTCVECINLKTPAKDKVPTNQCLWRNIADVDITTFGCGMWVPIEKPDYDHS